MDLTDQQWQLIQPLFNEHFQHATPRSLDVGGRPPIEPRPVLDAILWKIRNNAPWYYLPKRYPSHQTTYRRYRLWVRTGLLDQVFLTLQDNRYRVLTATELLDTWQLSTALVFIQLAITRLRAPRETPG